MRAKQPGETVKQYLQYQIRELTADRDKWRNGCKRLIGHYGQKRAWEYRDDHEWYDVYRYASNGYDFAHQIQKEIDDDTTTEKMSQSTAEK